jgi:hypoxanthine phosphoribosyltransferase
MKKVYYTWKQVEGACLDIAKQINNRNWRPDYIVGITRGGLVPAVLLSQYLEVPMQSLDVSLRDGGSCVSNCGMSEDAFGYVGTEMRVYEHIPYDVSTAKNILIVDDINDQGSTIAWIKQDWESSCLPGSDRWDRVWGENVRFATLTNNIASKETVDYSVWEVNKAEEDCWLVYPWEDFWL